MQQGWAISRVSPSHGHNRAQKKSENTHSAIVAEHKGNTLLKISVKRTHEEFESTSLYCVGSEKNCDWWASRMLGEKHLEYRAALRETERRKFCGLIRLSYVG